MKTGEGERMRIKTRASTRRKGRVASKMPKIEFNVEAIKAIKKRKGDRSRSPFHFCRPGLPSKLLIE